jgi:S1-C subfamily serine protease
MEDMDDTSPSTGNAGEPVHSYEWPRPDTDIPQAEAWPGFHAGLPAPPGFPLPPGPAGPPGRRPPARRRHAVVAGLIAVTLLLSGVIGVSGGALWRDNRDTTITQDAPNTSPPASVGPVASAVAASVAPAIVNVNTYATTFDSTTSSLVPLGAGTGMILTSTGEVLTNNHVVEGASRIDVEVAGHSGSYTAEVLGVDPSDDVALLQLQDASGLPTVSIGSASTLSSGQDVIAIGNALGLGGAPSVTTGTISSLHRSITAHNPSGDSERLDDLIQTDAAIQPGDSGGALVNSSGEVIGMITAGAAGTDPQTPSTVGFAIPLDNAISIVSEIRAGHGSSTILLGERGFLGVSVNSRFDFSTAPALGIDATSGAMVIGVQPGSPAEGAGITAPAVIQSIDGQTVGSTDDLGPLLHVHVPGEQVQVTWVDANGTHTATVALGPGPAV